MLEKIKNKLTIKKLFLLLIIFGWLTIIFCFSASSSIESNKVSQSALNKVLKTTLNKTNSLGITNKNPSQSRLDKFVLNYNEPFRKFTHAGIYFVLSIFILLFLKNSSSNKLKIYLLCLFICFLAGLLDEYHQTFVSGRTGQISDVLIDLSGSILGMVFYYFISKNFYKKIN